MAVNSGKLRGPVQMDAEGQSRAKQLIVSSMGACREQVLPPEGKVCSDLHRNMQRLMETVSPALEG